MSAIPIEVIEDVWGGGNTRAALREMHEASATWKATAIRHMREKGEWKAKCLSLEVENERLRAAIFDLNKAFTAFNREADAAAES